MSRLIIKGLPGSITEDKLRRHFAGHGAITDCQLKYTRDGVFRRFAFIGFDTEENAQKVANHFNNTFIGTTRITVEECKPFGDDTKPRAWSKYSRENQKRRADDSEEVKHEENDGEGPPVKKSKPIDAKLSAFLGLHGQNTDEQLEGDHNIDESQDLMAELMKGIYGDTSLSLVFNGLPASIKANSLKDWLMPVRFKAVKIVRNKTDALAFVTFNRTPDVRRALLRNEQYLGGFRVKIDKAPAGQGQSMHQEDDEPQLTPEEEAEARKTESEKTTAAILDTGRLFVRNLPYICTNDDLLFLFKPFGEIAECENIIDKKTGKSKGFAVITFVFPENAAAAYAALDGSVFKGRMLHLLPGDEKRDNKALDPSNQKGLSAFQKEKQAKLKANAGKSHSWNALFLGANAVADTLANKLAVSKADLLTGDDESSAGVRLALAETRLVRETREFLLQHGVKLDAFSRPATKRSDTVIIVKNLPANTDDEELKRMFGRFGDLKQFIMPPEGGVSAIVEMSNSVDAKKAFASLAYSRFRNQPLYLEWAPLDVFADRKEETKPSGSGQRETKTESKVEIKEEVVEAEEPEQEAEGTEPVEEVGATLFVKNLNFDTTDNTLEKHFSERWPVVKATVSLKKDAQHPDKRLSMGFGFVQFNRKADAEAALRECQGELLDGHAIEVKLSHREEQKDETVTRKRVSNLEQGDCTNIMVRNIPFQAVKKEITQLFSAFGELKSVRLPKRVGSGGSHRGFGFVDFMTKGDAKRAFDSLVHSTHLYGRRLVLEWAKAEDSIEDLRERTKEKFSGEKGFKKKKERLDAIERKVAELADD